MNENEVIQFDYSQPNFIRIFSAHLFDFFASLVSGAIFFSFLLLLLHCLPFYKNNKTAQVEIQIRSHLYVQVEETGSLLTTSLNSNNELTTQEKNEKLDSALTFFFDHFLKENTQIEKTEEVYSELLSQYRDDSGRKMFDENRNRLFTNDDEDKNYYTAYGSILTRSALGFLSYVNNYSSLRRNVILANIFTLALSLFLGSLLFYLVFPMIFFRGKQTLGMKFNKIGYIALDCFSPSGKRWILYFLFQSILIFLGSFFSFGAPLFLSVGMMFFSKRHQTLSEYVLGVLPIDVEKNTIYLDYFEFKAKEGKIDKVEDSLKIGQ